MFSKLLQNLVASNHIYFAGESAVGRQLVSVALSISWGGSKAGAYVI